MSANQQALLAAGSGTSSNDPFFSDVVALLHFDNNLTDQIGHTFTATGTAAASATQSKFGGFSLSCPSGSNYISAPSSTDWDIGSSDFTIEGWVWRNSVSGSNTICSRWATPRSFILFFTGASNQLSFGYFTTTVLQVNFGLNHNTANVWDYISVSRTSGTMFASQNGTALSSAGVANFSTNTHALAVGIDDDGTTLGLNGFIDDFRITKGVGRYGATNYTAPTAALPNF